MERLRQWCEDVNKRESEVTYDYLYVEQEAFEQYRAICFEDFERLLKLK